MGRAGSDPFKSGGRKTYLKHQTYNISIGNPAQFRVG